MSPSASTGASAATPTPLVQSSKIVPTKVTSTSPNPTVPAQKAPNPGVNAPTSTPSVHSSKMQPSAITKNTEATSSSPTSPLSAQKASNHVTKPSQSQDVTPHGPVTPRIADTPTNQLVSSLLLATSRI